jgi:hypothetical protein
MELGDDLSLLTQLYGLGMISSPGFFRAAGESGISGKPGEYTGERGRCPEPVKLRLFAAGLALLGLYAAERGRRLRYEPIPAAIIDYGPL